MGEYGHEANKCWVTMNERRARVRVTMYERKARVTVTMSEQRARVRVTMSGGRGGAYARAKVAS